MVDRDSIEKSLLLNVVKQKCWNDLIINDINEELFTPINKPIYEKIKQCVNNNEYPDIQLLCYEFEIADDELLDYLQISSVQELCDVLKKEYLRDNVQFEVRKLNQYKEELDTDPRKLYTKTG